MSPSEEPAVRRRFNPFLAVGIVFLPIIFVWFLLRKGHSTTARTVGFVWAALFLLSGLSASLNAPVQNEVAEISAADRAEIERRAELQRVADRRRDIERSPENFLTLENSAAAPGGFDTVFLLTGAIRNSSEIDIKDPTFSCDLFGPSGTRIGRVEQILFEIVPANGLKQFTELNMGFMGSTQVNSYECVIVDAEALVGD